MKNKAFAALGLLAVLAFSGCDGGVTVQFSFVTDVDGKVFDARSADPISGATVSFKNSSGTVVASATTDALGGYSITDLSQGTYTVETSLATYAFGPIQMEVAGQSKTIPNIMGFSTSGLASGTVTLVVTWDGDVTADVDAAITIPPTGASGSATFKDYGSVGQDNFTPDETLVSGRQLIDWHDVGTAGYRGITLDIDAKETNLATQPRVETISLPPVLEGTSGTTVTNNGGYVYNAATGTGINLGVDVWKGVLEYYLDGYSDNLVSTNGVTANAKVFVFQDATVLGVFDLPTFTNIDRASVLRIHAFDWGYMIFPEVKAVLKSAAYRDLDKPYIATKRIK